MPRRNEVEEAEHTRSLRNEFYDHGRVPKADKHINPAMKRTAYEYDEWRRTQTSHHRDEGAFLNNLEGEEKVTGNWSYPPGHPRRTALEAGKDPDYVALKAAGSFDAEPPVSPQEPMVQREVPLARSAPPRPPQAAAAVRPNRYPGTCPNCGSQVGPGEGKLERTATGWSTSHHPRCP